MGLFEHRVPMVNPQIPWFIMILVKALAGNIAHSRIVFMTGLGFLRWKKLYFESNKTFLRYLVPAWYLVKMYLAHEITYSIDGLCGLIPAQPKLQLDHRKSQIIKKQVKHGKTVILSDIILL